MFQQYAAVVGPSGNGKTSLLQCGVANRFGGQNRKPVFIRRKQRLTKALHAELEKQAITPLKKEKSLTEKARSVYLDYLTFFFLIFDQFEELFIFGNSDEKESFIAAMQEILSHEDNNTHIILTIREEYLANLSEFEDEIPELFENRIRIRKMKQPHKISEPVKVSGEACSFDPQGVQ